MDTAGVVASLQAIRPRAECGFAIPHMCTECGLKTAVVCEPKRSCLRAVTPSAWTCGGILRAMCQRGKSNFAGSIAPIRGVNSRTLHPVVRQTNQATPGG